MQKVIALLQGCFGVAPIEGKSDPMEVFAGISSGGCHFSWAVMPPDVVLKVRPTRMNCLGVILREVRRSEQVNGLLAQKLALLRSFLREHNLDCDVEGPHEKQTQVCEQSVHASHHLVWVDLLSPGAGPLIAELLTEEYGHGV